MAKARVKAETIGKRMKAEGKAPATTGERVLARRKALGLSQAELAAKIGAHKQTISNIERGVLEPSRGAKMILAVALGEDPGKLFPEVASLMVQGRRRVVLIRDDSAPGRWIPGAGTAPTASLFWKGQIADGQLSSGIRKAVAHGVEVVFPALPPLE